MPEKKEEVELLTPEEKARARHIASHHGIDSKTYSRISVLAFVVVVILSFLINFILSLAAIQFKPAVVLAFVIILVAMFFYTFERLNNANHGIIYLFTISSVILLGGVGSLIAFFISGGVVIGTMSGLVGVFFAYVQLHERHVL